MSQKIGNTFYIEGEEPAKCAFCGNVAELRPYGPNDENICFDCAMKDEPTAARKFRERVLGPSEVKKQ